MSWTLSHPEIETRALNVAFEQHTSHLAYHEPAGTCVDLLEIHQDGNARWMESIDHDALLECCKYKPLPVDQIRLRVIFLKNEVTESSDEPLDDHTITERIRLHPATAGWMGKYFGVSPLFFQAVNSRKRILKTANIFFTRRNNEGKVVSIDGFYRYSSGYSGPISHVWFSHVFTVDTSTYIMHNCLEEVKKNLIHCAQGNHPLALARACAIDAFVAEDCADAWGNEYLVPRKELIEFEGTTLSSRRFSPEEIIASVRRLHYLSQTFQIIREDMTDLVERLEFLYDVHHQHALFNADFGRMAQETNSVSDSLKFLISRTKIWKRWVANHTKRTEIRINLFFNLATQNDSRTNLDIAHLTSKIALETQRDSSSMITIAGVTMFFLPGTFVSAIFSMVFFDSEKDSDGKVTFTVAPQWWYFPVITVPLTSIIFAVWVLWQRWRNNATLKGVVISGSFSAEKLRL